MAPSAGSFHLLVAKNVKILRLAAKKTSRFLQNVSINGRTAPGLQAVFARATSRQPIHPAAFLRQSKRWFSGGSGFSGAARRFTTAGASHVKYDRASFPASRVATAIKQFTGRAPFASTLRPNLTGGALGRTAGGYTLGSGRAGGARFFSHTPAAQAQVISNVSQAVRAFFVGGQKVQYDGVNPRTGEKRFKAVTALQEQACRKMDSVPKATPGSHIDFSVNPTITALTPLSTIPGFYAQPRKTETLNTEGLLDVLSVDFSRALKELATILNDLKRLAALGDLPITYQNSCLRVHFPGCDADTVERLALELGLQRGIIGQDPEFDAFAGTEIALLFPFAPSKTASECAFFEEPVGCRLFYQDFIDWRHEASPETITSPDFSTRSQRSDEFLEYDHVEENPWISSPSGYESLHSSELDDSGRVYETQSDSRYTPLEYQGIEGIYRFIEQCDAAARH
jgi:hypothetical protein